VYTCGEGSEIRTGTFYYWTEAKVLSVTRRANLVLAVLLLCLFVVPAVTEVVG
jgi:hypothetical protein